MTNKDECREAFGIWTQDENNPDNKIICDRDFRVFKAGFMAGKNTRATMGAVVYTGSGSLAAIKAGQEGYIWGTPSEAHPIPLYLYPTQREEWQPIETAPKGGTFLVCIPRDAGTYAERFNVALAYRAKNGTIRSESGGRDYTNEATLWAPLPNPLEALAICERNVKG
jgi:hypothetical protein